MSADEFDVTFADGYVTPGRRKNNWLASNTPTSAHGSNFRFEVGSVWVYTSNIWVCTDPTTGAAVWTAIDGSGGGGGFTNPMTTAGDIIKASSGGTAVRHAIGTDRQYLATSNTSIVWRDDGPLATDLSVSGSHDIDYGLAATHDLTLTGNATFTLSGAITDQTTDLRIILRQDGTGSRTVTWPGSITWAGGSAPTLQNDADAVDTIGLLTVDDGTTWLGYHATAGTTDHGALDGLTDNDHPQYSLTDHQHTTAVGELLISDTPAGTPLVFSDVLQNEDQDDLLYEDAVI